MIFFSIFLLNWCKYKLQSIIGFTYYGTYITDENFIAYNLVKYQKPVANEGYKRLKKVILLNIKKQ